MVVRQRSQARMLVESKNPTRIAANFASIATSVFVLADSLPGVAERRGEYEEEVACLTGRSRSRMIESPLLASSSFSGDHLCIQCSVSVEPVAQIAGI